MFDDSMRTDDQPPTKWQQSDSIIHDPLFDIIINHNQQSNNPNNDDNYENYDETSSLSSTIEPYDFLFIYHPNQSDLNLIPLVSSSSSSSSSSFYDVTSMANSGTTLSTPLLITLSIILIFLILATIIGNVFVISAVIFERSLRSVGNYLVVSLAITDLMVACLVMPIGAIYEVTGEWRMGIKLCELWTFIDVLCCTTSIFHLLAISCDRLWAVTTVDYIHRRKAKHVCAGIAIIWLFSAIISLGPMLGWKDNEFEQRIVERKECMISQDISYQIFATIASFYAPSILLLLQYYRIYQVAKTRLKLKKQRYQYRIRRRPSFYRTRKESELKEFPRVTHRISINTNEEFFSTSTAIQPPPSSTSGVYSSSTNTDYTTNTNTTTNTTLSTDQTSSIISISPPAINTLKPLQTTEQHPVVSTKRFSIVQFFHPQPVDQQFDDDFIDVDNDDEDDDGKFSMTHFDDYCDNNDLRSNETSIDESTIIVGAEPTSNIVVYVDDYGSTICSSCDPTENCSSGNGVPYYHYDGQSGHGDGNNIIAKITADDQINEKDEFVDNPFDEIAVTINNDDDLNANETQTPPIIEEDLFKECSSESPITNLNTSELRKINVHSTLSPTVKETDNPLSLTIGHSNNQQQQHHYHRHKHPSTSSSSSKKHKRRRIKKLKFKNKILRFDNNNGSQQQQNDSKQESKAAKTLTIITGVFIICWLPFFVIALVMPLCGNHCYINRYAFDFFIWLGWANSTLNPFLYTIFSPDFRNAFKKLSKRIKG
ncbi:G-protein coupled receptor [Dermatophagoides pteronyssinus]|uniref:G-protein coupled receptor n=1 Tax=Dermatophagoides pteronyssinus TaxID=6956 RepID=A0ABQ8IVU0_DERPT|nr:G-protein coupled receptor [Dermatophagoides pteronyssinus]